MVLPATPAGRLYVVRDGGRLIVSRSKPVVAGPATTTGIGSSVVELTLRQRAVTFGRLLRRKASVVRGVSPGTVAAGAVAAGTTAAATCEVLLLGTWSTFWLSLPLGCGIAAYAAGRFRRRKTALDEAWHAGHHVLDHPRDIGRFEQALAAAKKIAYAWPYLGQVVGIPDPGADIARALWELDDVLARRSEARINYEQLLQAYEEVAAGSPLRAEVTERLHRLHALVTGLNGEIDRRIAPLERIAAECLRFAREQQALDRARQAVRHAEEVLGSTGWAPAGTGEPGEQLSARIGGILTAYRELTGGAPTG